MKIGIIILPIVVISIGITILTILVAIHFIAKFW